MFKIINKKIVAAQLTHYLDSLLLTYQSGFCKCHSMETLLVHHLLSDSYVAIDKSKITLLGDLRFINLFNASAAFNTVGNAILLQHLSISFGSIFGLSGNALCWLTSFMQDRSFMVAHSFTRSQYQLGPCHLECFRVLLSDPSSILLSLLTCGHCLRLSSVQLILMTYRCSAGQAICTV